METRDSMQGRTGAAPFPRVAERTDGAPPRRTATGWAGERVPPQAGEGRLTRAAGQAKEMAQQMRHDEAMQAREILHVGFTAAPLIAGIDKFTEALVDWDQYLDPRYAEALGMSRRQFMRMVGVIEIGAGLLVAAKPKWGSLVVAGWLGGFIGNLMTHGKYYDIALRDFGLMLGAIALNRLESRA